MIDSRPTLPSKGARLLILAASLSGIIAASAVIHAQTLPPASPESGASSNGSVAAPSTPAPPSGPAASPVSRLPAVYPDFIDRIDGNELVWRDGTRTIIDDGRGPKSAEQRFLSPDIKDIFATPYVPGPPAAPPGLDEDPGRARPTALFDKMYGDCTKGETQKLLVDVVWLPNKWGQKLKVTKVNGVADRVAAISLALDALPARFDQYLVPPAGTFNCRAIAGTTRPSAHGSGIAIDMATAHAHYWRWSKKGPDGRPAYRNNIPPEIVAIFEAQGFIWGGKWYHFDTMHFEYRPELLPPVAAR